MAVRIHIDRLLVERGMSVGEFAEAIGITPTNVAVLKNGRARAIRFTTLDAICRVLRCQPGEVMSWTADQPPSGGKGTFDDYRPVAPDTFWTVTDP